MRGDGDSASARVETVVRGRTEGVTGWGQQVGHGLRLSLRLHTYQARMIRSGLEVDLAHLFL